MQNAPYILAIESSCDDTSAAVLLGTKVLSNEVASQAVHEAFGGVVPELASRAHQLNIVPVVDRALKVANISPQELNAIAFTNGPGLLGSLLVGTSFAKSLALGLAIPLVPVHHMHAHVLAHLIEDAHPRAIEFPFLCLTVSGGHTQLIEVQSPSAMTVLGETIDDAVGEAFDKAAKILGLPYPGGPHIDQFSATGDPTFMSFNESNLPGFNFSFSGMKTSFLYALQKEMKVNPNFINAHLNDICASYQHALIQVLMKKLKAAQKSTNIKNIAIAGGVSANSGLRDALTQWGAKKGLSIYLPPFQYTTDNAAMIGIAGYYQYLKGVNAPLSTSAQAKIKF
ncbi:MAG: tRNA (adenosine(37)-N6)-threonylcarbamoyltransferase complex transferase subunit TsaD [Bacteroidetes bacterium]|nr:tRNA (adenosine(37)-N6)-threonylcarbamoyltransferase complex transferase subunit TsaD [Bacteroidota bacterium]MDA0897930.1 tRNA (adenosine(37)-N6)-threonylcarbamoyltransferase complex transferase subunit TsaD [Bacteroidota bacterium]